jgi:hypothetical protein
MKKEKENNRQFREFCLKYGISPTNSPTFIRTDMHELWKHKSDLETIIKVFIVLILFSFFFLIISPLLILILLIVLNKYFLIELKAQVIRLRLSIYELEQKTTIESTPVTSEVATNRLYQSVGW